MFLISFFCFFSCGQTFVVAHNARVFSFFHLLVFAGRGNTLNEDFSSLTIDNISARYF